MAQSARTTVNMKKPILQKSQAVYKGKIQNNAFYFTVTVNGKQIHNMMLDTGAFELTFDGKVADKLGLPRLGVIKVSGIGGVTLAYLSRCILTVGRVVYRNVPCIIVPQFKSPGLFGLRFLIDQQLKLELNPIKQTLMITKA